MKTLKKSYRIAHAEGKNWRQEMYRFLRNYRATPHPSTGQTPAFLLFGRHLKTHLPQMIPAVSNATDAAVHARDTAQKEKMKTRADARDTVKQKSIELGDVVLVKRDGHVAKDVTLTPYNTVPYQVIVTKGTKITAERPGQRITRNAAFFKVLKEVTPLALPPAPTVEDEDDDDVEIAAPKTPEHPDRQAPLPPLQNQPAEPENDLPAAPRRNPPRARRQPNYYGYAI